MKDNSKMMSIMDLEDLFTLTEITIQASGWTASVQVMESQSIRVAEFTRVNGNIANTWENENITRYINIYLLKIILF